MLRESLARVRERIQEACRRVGRPPSSVRLIGVTKGVPPDLIQEALALGVADLGENRVQEARAKQRALGSRFKVPSDTHEPRTMNHEPVRWHMIGHLQRNKAKDAVELFDTIHSVDSAALVEELERQAGKRVQGSRFKVQGEGRVAQGTGPEDRIEVLLQVNVSGEATKFGCAPEEAEPLARAILQRHHLRLSGLMTLAPFTDEPEGSRPHFRRLRQLRDELASSLHPSPSTLHLSMGMSQDFEVAIEEGADLVRIGAALFWQLRRGMGRETWGGGRE